MLLRRGSAACGAPNAKARGSGIGSMPAATVSLPSASLSTSVSCSSSASSRSKYAQYARLGLAPVIVDQLGHQPAGTLIVVPVLGVVGDAGGERGLQRVELRLQLGVRLPGLGWRLPRDLLAERLDRLVATGEQPFAQQVRGAAVVLVVALDRLQQRAIAGLQEPLEGDDRVAAFGDLRVPLAHVERLDALDRVVRLPDPQPLTHDRVEIDQDLPAQQPIDLLLTRRVQTHQPLDRGRLIRGVVVDVQVGEALAAARSRSR